MTTATAQRPPTEAEVRLAVQKSLKEALSGDVDGMLHQALFLATNHSGLWERWTCNDDKCPARPEYDHALARLLDDWDSEPVAERIEGLFVDAVTARVMEFVAEHPEAPRAD